MAQKSKKFKLQTKDGKISIETDSAIQANQWRAEGLVDAPSKASDETSKSGTDSKSESGSKATKK